jgi:hypothetical protein
VTWGNQPTNPYQAPAGPTATRRRWARKRIIIPTIVAAWFIGVGMGSAGGDTSTEKAASTKAAPAPTVTVTATAAPTATATVTASPKPAVTVTKVKTRTVRVTVTAQADTYGSSGGGGSVYYSNCSEARAAGDTPLYRGDPGYASHLDRDGDGVACE